MYLNCFQTVNGLDEVVTSEMHEEIDLVHCDMMEVHLNQNELEEIG